MTPKHLFFPPECKNSHYSVWKEENIGGTETAKHPASVSLSEEGCWAVRQTHHKGMQTSESAVQFLYHKAGKVKAEQKGQCMNKDRQDCFIPV